MERVIPLPKEMEVRGSRTVSLSDVGLIVQPGDSPLLETVRKQMAPFVEEEHAAFTVRFVLAEEAAGHMDLAQISRLSTLPHAKQAYAIAPVRRDNDFAGLCVVAQTEQGLLYGARSLRQMVGPTLQDGSVTFPELELTDWPDVGERGQWGGSAAQDLAWLAQRKFNVVEYQATLSCGEDGRGSACVDSTLLAEAAQEGILLVPYITHLELLFQIFNLFDKCPELASTPNPAQPLPSDYTPGICFSNPESVSVLSDWLVDLVKLSGVTEVMVWLSEDAAPCFCTRCKGQEPFTQEVAAISRAFEQAKAENPSACLRILLTQGSYVVNDRVLAAAPPDVKITYYHGGLTYDSTHRPMIYPALEAFARSGRWLGVYPQVTTAWRAVTPFTGPQFVRARMTEFASKGLSNVITYAVPANRFHAFNVTASAEWLWNSKGRTDEDFSRAWAVSKEMPDPGLFARWVNTIGPVAWNLAGSRVALRLIFSIEEQVLDGAHPFRFGESILAEIHSESHLQEEIHAANRALSLALELGDAAAVAESRIHRAFLELAGAIKVLSEAPADPEGLTAGQLARFQTAFETVDLAARTLEVEHFRWAEVVAPGELPWRLLDTIAVGYRVAASAAAVMARLGLPDPAPEFRPVPVGSWSSEDFEAGPSCRLSFDLSGAWYGPGPYVVTFQYRDGAYGATVVALTLVRLSPDGQRTELERIEVGNGVNRFEKWREIRIRFPKIERGDTPYMEAELKLPDHADPGRRISSGDVVVRRGLHVGPCA